jgi:hypothetical protein
VSSWRRAFSIAPATSEALETRKSTSLSVNSRGASVWREITPMTPPSFPRIGTERSDWNRSSSSSATYFERGSVMTFWAKAGSRRSAAHHAIPSPRSSTISSTRAAYGSGAAARTSRPPSSERR